MKTLLMMTGCLLVAATSLSAATRTKANNADNLNVASSWTNNAVPGSADVAQFDSTVTGALTLSLGANTTWNQINFVNPGGGITLNGGSTLTLSNNNPIVFGSGAADLTLNCDLICGGAAFTTLRSPVGQTVTFGGSILGRDTLVTLGNSAGTIRLGSPTSVRIGATVQVSTAGLKLGIGASSVGEPLVSGPLGTNLFTWNVNSATAELFAYNGAQVLGNPFRVQLSPLNFNSQDDLTFTGVVDLNAANRIFNVTSNGMLRFTGVISNATGLTKTGSGVLELGGTIVSTFANGLSIFGGTVRCLTNDVLPDGVGKGTLRMTNTAQVLDLNGSSDVINGMAGSGGAGAWAGTLDNTAAGTTAVLTVGDQFTYTLTGKIQNTGAGARLALIKTGTGGLIISNVNTFSGGLTIASASQVSLNAEGAAGSGPIVLAHTNAALAYGGGGSITWTNDIVVLAGTQPAISADDGSVLNIAGNISGPGRLWVPDNLFERGPLTFSGDSTFTGGLWIAGGTITLNHPRAVGRGTLIVGDPLYYTGGSLNLIAGANLTGANALTNTAVFNRNFTIGGSQPIEFAGPITLAFTAPQVSINVTNPAGAVLSGPIGGTGFGFNKTGPGVLTLSGVSTYTGPTSLSTGNLALGPGGALPGTSQISVGQLCVFDVSGAGGLSIGATQTLRGTGTLKGDVTVHGTLVSSSPFFSLTFSNNLTLGAGSTTTLNISRDILGGSEPVVCRGALTYGGSLVVNNLGSPFQLGDTFDLFGFTGNPGNFASLVLPGLDPAFVWDTGNLAVDGTIRVVVSPPRLSQPLLLDGTNFVFTATAGTTNGTFRLLTQTNVAAPLANWQSLATNMFDAAGSQVVTSVVNRAEAQRFFRIVQP